MSIFTGLLAALVLSIVSVGLIQVVKTFLPESTGTIAKALIALGIEVVIAAVGAFAIYRAGVVAVIVEVLATIAFSQLFFEVIVSLLDKLADFLKSKTK